MVASGRTGRGFDGAKAKKLWSHSKNDSGLLDKGGHAAFELQSPGTHCGTAGKNEAGRSSRLISPRTVRSISDSDAPFNSRWEGHFHVHVSNPRSHINGLHCCFLCLITWILISHARRLMLVNGLLCRRFSRHCGPVSYSLCSWNSGWPKFCSWTA